MSDHALLVGGGERPPDHLREEAEHCELIAIDGGARWILRWGLVPHRVMGDLDSLDDRSRSYTDRYGAPIEQFGPKTTRSDVSLVVDRLLDERFGKVTFTGCVGTRLDHTLALFAGMARLALAGTEVHVVERWGTGHVATPDRSLALHDLQGERASFFPLTARVVVAAFSGFDAGPARPSLLEPPFDGLSSVPIVAARAEVAVAEGALLVFVARRESPDAEDAKRDPKPTYRLGTLERTE